METSSQQKNQGHRLSIFSAVGGMVITFLAGIYVGLHPNWIPIKEGTSTNDYIKPFAKPIPNPATAPSQENPATMPQSQLSTRAD